MAGALTVYASIGNSDDKLPQQQWAEFHELFATLVRAAAEQVHGDWHSLPNSPWQNACMCFEITPEKAERLKQVLAEAASEFRQDSIAWAVAETEFVSLPRREPRSHQYPVGGYALGAPVDLGGYAPPGTRLATMHAGEIVLPAALMEA